MNMTFIQVIHIAVLDNNFCLYLIFQANRYITKCENFHKNRTW